MRFVRSTKAIANEVLKMDC